MNREFPCLPWSAHHQELPEGEGQSGAGFSLVLIETHHSHMHGQALAHSLENERQCHPFIRPATQHPHPPFSPSVSACGAERRGLRVWTRESLRGRQRGVQASELVLSVDAPTSLPTEHHQENQGTEQGAAPHEPGRRHQGELAKTLASRQNRLTVAPWLVRVGVSQSLDDALGKRVGGNPSRVRISYPPPEGV